MRYGRATNYGGGIETTVFIEDEALEEGCNSHRSPSNLVYARSHADLAGRPERPVKEGLNLREKLDCRDYWNWE